MWKVFDMVSNLLFYIISNLNPHCSNANLRESRQLRKLVKIAWAFTPGGAQTSTRVQTTTWWTWRKHECVAIIELQGETRKTVQGGASPPKMEVSNRTSGVRIIWVGYLGRGRNSWKMFKAKFGRDVKNAVLSLLLMARKIISFTSGTVNTITGIGIEIFVFVWSKNYFVMSEVLPLTRWKDKGCRTRRILWWRKLRGQRKRRGRYHDSCEIKEAEDYF